MGILSRLLLFFYVIAVMAGLVVCAGVCLNLFPQEFLQSRLNEIISKQETWAVIGVMFVASLCLLSAVFSSDKKKREEDFLSDDDIELQKGQTGEVRITVDAIKNVVEQAAVTVQGVRQVKAEVFNQRGEIPVKIDLEIILGQGYSAPKVSEEINSTVNQALQTATELSNIPVKIKVTEVTHAILEREKRVV